MTRVKGLKAVMLWQVTVVTRKVCTSSSLARPATPTTLPVSMLTPTPPPTCAPPSRTAFGRQSTAPSPPCEPHSRLPYTHHYNRTTCQAAAIKIQQMLFGCISSLIKRLLAAYKLALWGCECPAGSSLHLPNPAVS